MTKFSRTVTTHSHTTNHYTMTSNYMNKEFPSKTELVDLALLVCVCVCVCVWRKGGREKT